MDFVSFDISGLRVAVSENLGCLCSLFGNLRLFSGVAQQLRRGLNGVTGGRLRNAYFSEPVHCLSLDDVDPRLIQ